MIGTIKKLVPDKAYGFITLPDGTDAFFNASAVNGDYASLNLGESVEVSVKPGPKGPRATSVSRIGTANGAATRGREARPQAPRTAYRGPAAQPAEFTNPYNFVRYEGAPAHPDEFFRPPVPRHRFAGLSGRLTCRIEALTPLFVPDSETVDYDGDHRLLHFFQVAGTDGLPTPAIPGASLKGVVRSVFEAATNSCWSHFDGKSRSPYRVQPREAARLRAARVIKVPHADSEVAVELLDAARLHKDVYAAAVAAGRVRTTPVAWPAFVTRYPTQIPDHQELLEARILRSDRGVKVLEILGPAAVPAGPVPGENHTAVVTGYIKFTGPNVIEEHDGDRSVSKNYERFFFYADVPATQLSLSAGADPHDSSTGRYRATLDWQSEARNQQLDYLTQVPQRTLNAGDLVYVRVDDTRRGRHGEVLEVGAVSVAKFFYRKGPGDYLPGHLEPCASTRAPAVLCPACRLFGLVGPERTSDDAEVVSRAGRVRISTARYAGTVSNGHPPDAAASVPRLLARTIPILGSPKPSTYEFYLIDRAHPEQPVDWNGFRYYGYDGEHPIPVEGAPMLRGRKFYWHQEQPRTGGGATRSSQNATIDLVDIGTAFRFTVDYEDLEPHELGALVWSLTLEQGLAHHLGMGKPLGMGSVRIVLEQAETIGRARRYASIDLLAGSEQVDPVQWSRDTILAFQDWIARVMGRNDWRELANVADLLQVLRWPPPLRDVTYPHVINKEGAEQYRWFVANRSNRPGEQQTLPTVAEETDATPRHLPVLRERRR